jgi:TetR/AcrR family transcriptional regulator
MYRKLDEQGMNAILEAGIDEFAQNGLDRANINLIAKKAGVSVGVIYKYYDGKDQFFLACVRYSLRLLDQVLSEAVGEEDDISVCMENIVKALQENAAIHSSYYTMYHEITSGSCREYAKVLAGEIEQPSANAYRKMMENAKKSGRIRSDADARMSAFFFDNLLMMLQFSYSCDYYRERMKIYCGKDAAGDDAKVRKAFVSFMNAALK